MRLTSALYGGLIITPLAWIVSTQLGQILPYGDCGTGRGWTTLAAVTASILAMGGAALSLRRKARTVSRMEIFIGQISLLFGGALSFAVLLQAAATLVISPCAH